MNTEQLKMMLDAFAALGSSGKEAFIWWLALDKGLPVLGWLLTLLGLLWLARTILSMVSASSRMAKLRDEMGIGSPGPVWGDEARDVIKQVHKLMQQQKAG